MITNEESGVRLRRGAGGVAEDAAGVADDAAGVAEDAMRRAKDAAGVAEDAMGLAKDAAGMAEDGGMGMADGHVATRAEVCVVACAEAWRGDGSILASPMGVTPTLGAKLAQLTFSPGLLVTDGEATLLAPDDTGTTAEGWLPYRTVFTMVAAGLRHVMMGAAQLDRFGNQNISCIGDWSRPKAQLLGVRGAPGNSI